MLVADPESPRIKFPMQIVKNYNSETNVLKTHILGVTGDIGPLLNLILIKKE